MNLNAHTEPLVKQLLNDSEELRVHRVESGPEPSAKTQIIDCGIDVPGGLEAGRRLAEICLAGLARVSLIQGAEVTWPGPAVQVCTDQPIAACMASQYAGWEVQGEGFFAMGSGPMRAASGREELFDAIGYRESCESVVGVLESGKLPPEEVCRDLAEKCGVAPDRLTLLVAPTSSQAGNVQVVSRTVETTLHKLHELGFDLSRVESGWGVAPLPPVAKDDLAGIGRTNDAILYGGEVTLYVRGDDESLEAMGPHVPSCSSKDHGQPFGQIFRHYDNDFYKIDPHLFSPAVVRLVNLDTGKSHSFGHTLPRVLHESFTNG